MERLPAKVSGARRARSRATIVVASGLILTLTACGESGASGSSDESINFYNFPGYIGKNEVADFAEAFPDAAKIKQTPSPSTSQAPQVLAQDLERWDMAYLDTLSAPQMEDAGQLEPLDRSKIPNLKYVDEQFLDVLPDACIPTDFGKFGILYDSNTVKEPITSWEDFWNLAPKYSGKVVVDDVARDSLAIALIRNGLDPNSEDPDDLETAKSSLLELKEHALAFKSVDLAKPVAQGSAVMAQVFDFEAAAAVADNPNLKWVVPEEGALTYYEGWCAIKGTEHLADIEKFMNFHLDPKNYATWVDATGASPVSQAVTPYLSPDTKRVMTDPILQPTPNSVGYGPLSPEGTKLYNRVWDEIKTS
jgi:spermidine/putrescine transport system substrate-binding protein